MTTISRREDDTECGNSKGTAQFPHTLHIGRAGPAAFSIRRSHGEVRAIRQRQSIPMPMITFHIMKFAAVKDAVVVAAKPYETTRTMKLTTTTGR